MAELCELICELYAHPLDHSRPLWQVWVIEGLEGGRVAVLLLIHHALTDGIGILRMLNNFWQTRPEALEHPEPVEWHPAPLPSKWRLFFAGLRDLPGVVAANLPGAIRGSRAGRRIVADWRREGRTLPPTPGDPDYPAPYATRLSPRRTFAARSFPLARIRAVGKSLGVTINDVFLATLAGAIRALSYASRRAPLRPHRWWPRCRSRSCRWERRTRDGNFSTTCHTLLHTDVADPVERLQQVRQALRGHDEGLFRGDTRGEPHGGAEPAAATGAEAGRPDQRAQERRTAAVLERRRVERAGSAGAAAARPAETHAVVLDRPARPRRIAERHRVELRGPVQPVRALRPEGARRRLAPVDQFEASLVELEAAAQGAR